MLQQERPFITERLRGHIEPVLPGLIGLRPVKQGAETKYLTCDCQVGGHSFTLTFGELSEGQRILTILYAILEALAERVSLLVFDEPDHFVAEPEIQPWLSLLRERVVAAGRGTLLVISHHPEVIDYLGADQVLYVSRAGDGPSRSRLLEVDRETGQPVSTLLRLGSVGG